MKCIKISCIFISEGRGKKELSKAQPERAIFFAIKLRNTI